MSKSHPSSDSSSAVKVQGEVSWTPVTAVFASIPLRSERKAAYLFICLFSLYPFLPPPCLYTWGIYISHVPLPSDSWMGSTNQRHWQKLLGMKQGNGTPLQYSCLKIPWTEEPGGLQSWGRKESDTTEQLHFHFSLSRIGEGNGNPLQCSCLENPRDGGAWWAAVYGVAQSRTRPKRRSSSSSSKLQGSIVQHEECSQYFTVTINEIQPLKTVNQ